MQSIQKWFQPWLLLLFIIIVASAYRFPLLDTLPPGLNFDEGGEGVAALDVTQGNFQIWWLIGGGKQPLMAYLVQPLFWIFGPTRFALRLYTALMGVGAVAACYFFAVWLFETKRFPGPPKGGGQSDISSAGGGGRIINIYHLLPAFAALGLATAFWHVSFSRIAFRALSTPFVEGLALALFWQALRRERWRDFLWAGGVIGAMIYTYLAGWFTPVALGLFLMLEAVFALWQRQRPLLLQHWQKWLGLVGAAAVVAGPLLLYFALNPNLFFDRGQSVSIFSTTAGGNEFWAVLWHTISTTIGTFFSLTGDPNPLANIPGRPLLSPLLAFFFGLGLVVSLIKTAQLFQRKAITDKNNASESAPSDSWWLDQIVPLFLLCGWGVMLLPAILAPEGAPHHLRLIGTTPFTYTFIALGLVWLIQAVTTVLKSAKLALPLGWTCLIAVFGFVGWQTYHDYFVVWANEIDHYDPFDVFAEELAQQIAADDDPNTIYLIPMDQRAAHEARHYTLDFLYQGETPYAYIPVDEPLLAQQLNRVIDEQTSLKVVRWTKFTKHSDADEREAFTFALHTNGAQLEAITEFPMYNIESYTLPEQDQPFILPTIEAPIDITLDGLIQIRQAEVPSEITPNQEVAVAVTVAPIAPIEADYRASVRLFTAEGQSVSQVDRTLRHNWHQPTSLWPREEVNEYYLLPLPADTPPGPYQVRLVVYHPETLAPLTENGLVEVPLGEIFISETALAAQHRE